jgi:hypothetical protein
MTINEMDTTSLQSLMEGVAAAIPATSVARKAAHKKAILDFDIDHLLAMQDNMSAFINQMTACTFLTEDREELTEPQLAQVMTTLEAKKNISDLLEVWYQQAREAVFTHITNKLAANGVDEPEFAPGDAPVPMLEKKFAREGGKLTPQLDLPKLAEKLGTERWNKVHTTVTVPERTNEVLDEDKLLELVANDHSVLEIFKECITSGKRTPQKLNIRKLDGE